MGECSFLLRLLVRDMDSDSALGAHRKLGRPLLILFHVGAAVELQAKDFITCDLRQAALAKAAGLKVTPGHRNT